MGGADQRPDRCEELGRLGDALADQRVLLDRGALGWGERAGLGEDLAKDRALANSAASSDGINQAVAIPASESPSK